LVLSLVTLFAQTHRINIIGIFASLGVGGIAIAFSAQKVLEQLLGGVVIYIDRPFSVDDYIGLPDGTFGRVEAIGLRSTKIRTSGKGTLAVVPNSSLIQATVENFTGAKKVMAIVYLNLYRSVGEEEQALIRQVILESTQDIFGIDNRSTNIAFRNLDEGRLTQVQATLFILGATGSSMDIRRQLLTIANQKMTERLKSYGISFDIEEPTVYVDSPITI
jgi:MscS family membrane protein